MKIMKGNEKENEIKKWRGTEGKEWWNTEE